MLLFIKTQDINQLDHLVRETYLRKAVVAMYRKLSTEKIRPEAEVLSTICSVTYHWWHMIYARRAFTRQIRHALRGTMICSVALDPQCFDTVC